jgi:S-(hydroxymethyl)glutathione dehydrogenase/alcohol dehydrogenase
MEVTVKAAVCYEFGKPLVVEDVVLDPPGTGQVKVRVAATAVCHSDIHDIRGELPGKLPFVGGHETAGHVDQVGAGVTSVEVGDTVVVSLLKSCGKCFYCTTGLPHLCRSVMEPGKTPALRTANGETLVPKGNIGGFAEYVLVEESQVVKIPADISPDRACLLACGVSTGFGGVVNRAQVRPFNSVVVVGAGGVGVNAIQGAAYSGAYPIIAVDVVDGKLETALAFGATHTVNASRADAVEAVRQIASGRGADYVFVTVGSIAAIRQGFAMSGPRGKTVIIGLPPVKETMTLSPLELVASERTLTGAFMGSANLKIDIPNLVTLYRTGRLKLDELITGRYPLHSINEAIASTEGGGALRNVIVF